MYICDEIYNEEWSGVLFYDIKGSIKKIKTLVLTVTDFLPMNKGTKTHTGYDFDEDVTTYMMNKQLFGSGKQIGMIHSHNTMPVFFSTEDNSELEDNTPNHNFYLSLIVNNRMEMSAKVAYRAKTSPQPVIYVTRDENGDEYQINGGPIETEVMYWHKVDIHVPTKKIHVDKEFGDRVKFIIDKAVKQTALVKKTTYQPPLGDDWSQTPVRTTTTDGEDLTIYILNSGKNKGYQTMYNCLADIIKNGNEPTKFSKMVVEGYLKAYMKYYQILNPENINSTKFVERLESVIKVLKNHSTAFPFVNQTISQLESYKIKLYVTK